MKPSVLPERCIVESSGHQLAQAPTYVKVVDINKYGKLRPERIITAVEAANSTSRNKKSPRPIPTFQRMTLLEPSSLCNAILTLLMFASTNLAGKMDGIPTFALSTLAAFECHLCKGWGRFGNRNLRSAK